MQKNLTSKMDGSKSINRLTNVGHNDESKAIDDTNKKTYKNFLEMKNNYNAFSRQDQNDENYKLYKTQNACKEFLT